MRIIPFNLLLISLLLRKFFTLKEPDRLVIDLNNIKKDDLIPAEIEVANNLIANIRTADFNEECLRIVADLNRQTGYDWSYQQK